VGANGHLELDFAIDRTGGIDPRHAQRYSEFGAWIRACYGKPLAQATLQGGASNLTVAVPSGATIDRVVLEEDVQDGHVVAAWHVEVQVGGAWQAFGTGQPIGTKRIVLGKAVQATAVRLVVDTVFVANPTVTLSVFTPC
jgi:hypothetical protein